MNETKTKKLESPWSEALDDFSNKMINSAINGINEAVAKKQLEVDYWRNKTYILASGKQHCLKHSGKLARGLEIYVEKVECLKC